MSKFKKVANSSNIIDSANVIATAERSNDNGTDVMVVYRDDSGGYGVSIEYANGSRSDYNKTFDTKAEAMHKFNSLLENKANNVMRYEEYLLEKKMNQELSKGAPAKGKQITKQVKPETSTLPAGKGKSTSKTVKPNMADIPKGKGSVPSKSVKIGTTALPTKKGSAPKKMVDTKAQTKLVIKGKPINKQVAPSMAKLPIGSVKPNPAVKKASPLKK